jgi:hypothetical protein
MLNGLWKLLKHIKGFPDLVVMRDTDDFVLWLSIFLYG